MGTHRRCQLSALLLSIVAAPCGAAAPFAVPISLLTASDYRLAAPLRPTTVRSRRTPMLDRLFAPMPGPGQRRRSAAFAMGDLTLSAEALRVRTADTLIGPDGRPALRDRRWAGGLEAAWAIGSDDGLSFGIASSTNRTAEPAILAGRKHIGASTIGADLSWTHGANWQWSAGWERAGGAANVPGAERLVQIAQGAALHEQGFRMALAFAPGGLTAGHGPSFGFEARDMRLATDDATLLGAGRRTDVRALAFVRIRL